MQVVEQKVGVELGLLDQGGRVMHTLTTVERAFDKMSRAFDQHLEEDRKSFAEVRDSMRELMSGIKTSNAVLRPWMVLGGVIGLAIVNTVASLIVWAITK